MSERLSAATLGYFLQCNHSESSGFFTLSIVLNSKYIEITMFRKLDLFPSSGKGRNTSTLLGPLEELTSVTRPKLRITGSLDFDHRLKFQITGKQRLLNWICFRPQMRGGNCY
jgi:hypothetical protein